MRQNMLSNELREQLSGEQDRLLRAVSLYKAPVSADGLAILQPDGENGEPSQKRLLAYALLEEFRDRRLDVDYFMMPPVVWELLGGPGFGGAELRALHRGMGRYHRFQLKNVSRTLRKFWRKSPPGPPPWWALNRYVAVRYCL